MNFLNKSYVCFEPNIYFVQKIKNRDSQNRLNLYLRAMSCDLLFLFNLCTLLQYSHVSTSKSSSGTAPRVVFKLHNHSGYSESGFNIGSWPIVVAIY